MNVGDIPIGKRLTIGFSVVLALTLLLGIITFWEMNNLSDLTTKMYRHPFTVSNAAATIKMDVVAMHRSMKDVALAQTDMEIEEAAAIVAQYEQDVYHQFDTIEERFLGDMADVNTARATFTAWQPIRNRVINLMLKGERGKASAITKNEGAQHVALLQEHIDTMYGFAMRKAEEFFQHSQNVRSSTRIFTFFLLFGALLAGGVVAWLIQKSITSPLERIVANTRAITAGDLSMHIDIEQRDEIGVLATSFREMQDDLRNKADVAIAIAQGKLDTRIKTHTPQDSLATAINRIVDAFSEVVNHSNLIAQGDFSRDVALRSRDDELGLSLQKMTMMLRQVSSVAQGISQGDFSRVLAVSGEKDKLGASINAMTESLRDMTAKNERAAWIKSGQTELALLLSGEKDIPTLADAVIRFVAKYLDAQVGALFLTSPEKMLELSASYAFTLRKGLSNKYALGEGVVGQAAQEKQIISITQIPEDYIRISSALGETPPRDIIVAPFVFESEVKGVIELACIQELGGKEMEFLKNILPSIAVAINTAQNRELQAELLETSQELAVRLKAQQEELRASNEELESQTQALRASEEMLKSQQEELRSSNEELEEKNKFLEQHKAHISQKNIDLENARIEIEGKARQLEVTSKYKSEFLANMSHELRTPLNSMLILARNLSQNKHGNLDSDQIESAGIIYQSGNELLTLINEILDLSKIESGKLDVKIEDTALEELKTAILDSFRHMADEKEVDFQVTIESGLPPIIRTDRYKLLQVLKNLISNAIKFTEEGGITVSIQTPTPEQTPADFTHAPDNALAISVQDTGIGLAEEDIMRIFEAFQQVDGSTSRKYGGTGLGLSITRELIKLLGGVISVTSHVGDGSVFTIFIPRELSGEEALSVRVQHPSPLPVTTPATTPATTPITTPETIPTPAPSAAPGAETPPATLGLPPESDGKTIVIIEDDDTFARVVAKECEDKGLTAIVAATGEEGLQLVERRLPVAVILDLKLPGMDGYAVLEAIKATPTIRHIPVHIMSGQEPSLDAYKKGAMGFLRKPITSEQLDQVLVELERLSAKKVKDALVVEDNTALLKGISELLNDDDVNIHTAATGAEALDALKQTPFDCIILDLGLPDIDGFALLSQMEKEHDAPLPPIIVYTGKSLTREEEAQLQRYAESIIIKGVRSEERLLDEVSLFLHRVVDYMPPPKRDIIINLYDRDTLFDGKKVILVDDDMRNLFALSKVLEEKGMTVLKAEDGAKGLGVLNQNKDADLVIMDIMMPVMDGYETITRIREQSEFKKLPIIALTAKAMREDKDKCLEVGASDYMAKPVDLDRLFSMMRVWLYG